MPTNSIPTQYQDGEVFAAPVGFLLLTSGPSGLKAAQSDGSGNIKTTVTGAGSGGTSSVDEAAFTAAVSAGTPLMGVVNPVDTPANGVLAVAALDSARNLKVNLAAGSVTVAPVTSNTISAASQQTIGTTAGQVLAANAARKRLMLQNCGTTVLKIVLGAGTPTQATYHLALPACGAANDGSSRVWVDTMWTGAVQAISSAAGGLLQVEELT